MEFYSSIMVCFISITFGFIKYGTLFWDIYPEATYDYMLLLILFIVFVFIDIFSVHSQAQ